MQTHQRNSHRTGPLGGMLLAAMLLTAGTTTAAHAQKFKEGTLVVNLQSQIGTSNSKKGDTFTALVIEPAEFQGAIVEGTVTKVVPAAAGGDKSHIMFQFTTITMPDNNTYKLKATVKEVTNAKGVAKVDDEGQLVGKGDPGKKAMAIGGGAALGSLVGGMAFGGLGGIVGGAVAGGVAGWAVSLEFMAPGPNMDFAPGTHFALEAKNVGQDKGVKADEVRQKSADEAAKAAAATPVVADAPVDAGAPAPAPAPDPAATPAAAPAPSTPPPAL